MARKLEFRAHNTLQYIILLFCEGGVIADMDTIDEIISPELPSSEQDKELRKFVKKFNINHHSPYYRRRIRIRQSRFRYELDDTTPYKVTKKL